MSFDPSKQRSRFGRARSALPWTACLFAATTACHPRRKPLSSGAREPMPSQPEIGSLRSDRSSVVTFRIAQISDTHLSAEKPFFVGNFERIGEALRAIRLDLGL